MAASSPTRKSKRSAGGRSQGRASTASSAPPSGRSETASSAGASPRQPPARARALDVDAVIAAACDNLVARQDARGAWAGEVVWNVMLPCQWVITQVVLERPIAAERRASVIRQLEHMQLGDGGWGMHPDSDRAFQFHTTLAYVTLRLLDVPAHDPVAARALAWLRAHAPASQLPTWGRIWLALLGLYPWTHVQPILPEAWLQPDASPAHPRRLYCHMRLIYLGLGAVYGLGIVARPSARIEAIRAELYPGGYDAADFDRDVDTIAATDAYDPVRRELRWAFAGLRQVNRVMPSIVRGRALARVRDHIRFEFESTGWVCLSPVNGMLFTLALSRLGGTPREIERAIAGIEYWVWEDEEEGFRVAGARSDIWDTAFSLTALAEADVRTAEVSAARGRAASWLQAAQIRAEIPGGREHYREPALGGWGFADERHPWPVSDCTAEAVEALLRTPTDSADGALAVDRVIAAIEFILRRQNDDGGFGSYEARRGAMVLRDFNPAEIYGNCMLEYSYVECTASCARALAFARDHTGARASGALHQRISAALRAADGFLRGQQRPDGGWNGFWGLHHTYGTKFAMAGLRACGAPAHDPAIVAGGDFLVGLQRADGGWFEHWRAALDDSVATVDEPAPSHPVQTAWAMLALSEGPEDRWTAALDRAAGFLSGAQLPDGSWPSPQSVGVFFNTAVLDYRHYRHVFPLWALARWRRLRPEPQRAA